MATNSYALTTIDRIKSKLGMTTTQSDTMLTRIVYACTDYIENACSQRFQRTTYTNELYDGSNIDGSPKSMLFLKNGSVTTISSFQYRTGSKTSATWVDFQADTYQEMLALGVIRVRLPSGLQNIRISYIAGYLIDFANENDPALHTLPFDITDLCERLAIKYYKRRESEGRSAESFGSGGGQSSITWKDDLSDEDKTVIGNYARTEFV